MSDVLVVPAFVSPKPAAADATKIDGPKWNAARLFSAGNEGDVVVRRAASATGAAWEVPAAVAAAAGTLTGNTLAGNVLASSLTSLGTLSALSVSGAAPSFTRDALAAVSTDGLVLQNTTAATAGVPVQMSPRLRLRSHVWNTTTPADNTDDWFIESVPVNGATPSGLLKVGKSLNGGATTYPLTVDTSGNTSTLNQFRGTGFSVLSKFLLRGGTNNGAVLLTDDAGTVGVVVDATTDAVLKIRTRAQTGDASLTALDGTFSGNLSASAGTITTGSNFAFNSKGRLTAVSDGVFSFLDSSSVAGSVSAAKVLVGDGLVGTPALTFTSETGLGLYRGGSNNITFAIAGANYFTVMGNALRIAAGIPFGFTATNSSAANDTAFSRTAAGVVALGTGAQGNAAGTFNTGLYQAGGTSGVATFGPAAVTSITVKGGIITAIS